MKKSLLSAVIAATVSLPTLAVEISVSESLPTLETVVVVSSRTETPLRELATSVSVLDEAQIKALGFPSLVDVLRAMPSVSVSNSGGQGKATSISIRGEEGYRTLVRVDGVDISDPTGPQATSQIQNLLNASVARVEVLRGPQGLMYGADAGGVVNITTDHVVEGMRGDVNFEVGSFDGQKRNISLGGGGDLGDYYVSAAHARTDGFNASIDDTELLDNDGYKNTTYHGRLGWNIVDNLRLDLVLRDVDTESAFDRCFTVDNCVGAFDQQNARAALAYNTENFTNTFAYSKTDVERTNFSEGAVSFATEGEIAKVEYTGSAALTDAHKLVYGLEQRKDIVKELERKQTGIYAEYQGAFAEQFYITAGMRQDDNDDFGKNTSYRLSAAYLLSWASSGTLKLKTSFGTGFRAPSLFEVDFNKSQIAAGYAQAELLPALKQEESKGFDIGVEYFSHNGLHLEAVLFNQSIDNEIYFDLDDYTGYLQGVQTSRSKGVELIADIPVCDSIVINANYTYVDAKADDGAPRSRKPKHLTNIGILYKPTNDWTVSGHLRAARGAVVGSNTKLDSYQVFDANIRYQLDDMVSIYIRGENLTDKAYVEVPGYNTAGRTGFIGFNVIF